MLLLIAVIAAIMIPLAYANEQTVDVPFVPDEDKLCTFSYDENLGFTFVCSWSMIPTDEEIIIVAEKEPELIPEAIVDAIIEKHLVTIEPPKPKTIFEIEIVKLTERLAKEGELVSHEDQLLKALLSLQEDCELGTLEGAPIQTYKLFTIATFEPYTHTDLGTQYILKEIELAIQECKSQKILREKVLGDQYLHIPSTNQPKIIYQTNATLPADVQAKYDEAKMSDYFAQKSIDTAEGFQCSILGKQQGHCIKEILDEPVPGPTISQAGREVLSKYNAYQQTGIADIPPKELDAEPDRVSTTIQYLKSLGWSTEQIDAAIAALEDESNE